MKACKQANLESRASKKDAVGRSLVLEREPAQLGYRETKPGTLR